MDFPKNLLKKCSRGDRKSQKALYHHFSSSMYGVCLRYFPNPEIAQEILKDGFIRVFETLNTFRFQESLEVWIKRIIVNTVLDYYRQNFLESEAENGEEDMNKSEACYQGSDFSLLLSLVVQLPTQYRIVFNLFAIEGYDNAQIAQQLCISESACSLNYSRAKAILRERILDIEKSSHHAIL